MMILLGKEGYNKLFEPLSMVKINHLFARSVIEQCVNGKVYVDNREKPATFYVVHPYGMSLLFGASGNEAFNECFRDHALNSHKTRNQYEWMQAYSGDWNIVLHQLLGDRMVNSSHLTKDHDCGFVELNTRINFKFNLAKYQEFKTNYIAEDLKVVRTDHQMFREIKGSVIPSHFWNSADEFYEKGVGFSLLHEGRLASTAYSAFIHDDQLEIGIETSEGFRGHGFAQYSCSLLIDYCMERQLEPVWACRKENTGSYQLARKLGFEPVMEIPYYRLSK